MIQQYGMSYDHSHSTVTLELLILPSAGGLSLCAISAICRVLVLRAIRGTTWQPRLVHNFAALPYISLSFPPQKNIFSCINNQLEEGPT